MTFLLPGMLGMIGVPDTRLHICPDMAGVPVCHLAKHPGLPGAGLFKYLGTSGMVPLKIPGCVRYSRALHLPNTRAPYLSYPDDR